MKSESSGTVINEILEDASFDTSASPTALVLAAAGTIHYDDISNLFKFTLVETSCSMAAFVLPRGMAGREFFTQDCPKYVCSSTSTTINDNSNLGGECPT